MTGTPSSARESIVSRYSSTGGWNSWGECACSFAMTVDLSRHGGRYVECGIPVEEAERDQAETGGLDRHDRPVLGPGDVGDPERVPHHNIGVHHGTVPSGPGRQSGPATVLVGVVAGGVALVLGERRHPQVVRGEGGPLPHAGGGVSQQCRGRPGKQLVRRRLTDGVAAGPVDDLPTAAP